MPAYRFVHCEGTPEEIHDDTDLPDHEAASHEALRSAQEFISQGILKDIDRSGWTARVSENGEPVVEMRFGDLINRRGGLQ